MVACYYFKVMGALHAFFCLIYCIITTLVQFTINDDRFYLFFKYSLIFSIGIPMRGL
jgi:hypothetical protein